LPSRKRREATGPNELHKSTVGTIANETMDNSTGAETGETREVARGTANDAIEVTREVHRETARIAGESLERMKRKVDITVATTPVMTIGAGGTMRTIAIAIVLVDVNAMTGHRVVVARARKTITGPNGEIFDRLERIATNEIRHGRARLESNQIP